MFRRLSDSLPKDPVFPTNLEKLGYFINENDQIRMISHPTEKYHYRINQRERINELYKEAHNACIRHEILTRLQSLNLHTLRLPLNTPSSTPHIPILTSRNLSTCRRILIYLGERNQDLGIFAYRIIGGDEGVNAGSAVDFVQAAAAAARSSGGVAGADDDDDDDDASAIVMANPGQLIWCRSQGRAMGRTEWENLLAESAVHPGLRLDGEEGGNLVEGNRDEREHVEYVFEHVLKGAGGGQARIDVIGSEWTGAAVVRYLGGHWSTWSNRINGICLIAPLHGLEDLLPHSANPSASPPAASPFPHFISTRCRSYVVHEASLGTLVEGRAEYGCNVYASGEHQYVECIMIRAWRDMLGWFGRLSGGEEGAEERWEIPGSGLGREDGRERGDGEENGREREEGEERVDEGWAPDVGA